MVAPSLKKQAKEWAQVLVRELADKMRSQWAEGLASRLSRELQESLQEDFQEILGPGAALLTAARMAATLKARLHAELAEDLPEDLRGRLVRDLEVLVSDQLALSTPAQQIWQVAAVRQRELAEQWARWLACQHTSRMFKELRARSGSSKDPNRPATRRRRSPAPARVRVSV